MFYSVVLLDGKELHCLSLDQVQDLFFKRQLNQNSLVCNAEDGKWQMLKRAFDIAQWIPNAAQAVPEQIYQPAVNPFEQTGGLNQSHPFQNINNPFAPAAQTNDFQTADPTNRPVNFNQFPPNPTNSFAHDSTDSYSQNNQTETYYQAETSQTNYNFQNNDAGFAPSKYSAPAGSYSYSPNFPPNTPGSAHPRPGLRAGAVFLFGNALFYAALLIFAWVSPDSGMSEEKSEAYHVGRKFGMLIPLLISLSLGVRLWSAENSESARKWALGISYLGFIAWGLFFSLTLILTGNALMGAFGFVFSLLYFTSMALVLHGKDSPSATRIITGSATYAVYFLIMFGSISLAFIGTLAPQISKLNTQNARIDQFRVEGKDFQDKTTGAKVVLPEGWTMVSLDNPLVRSPEARMIAVDTSGRSLAMLEVVPVPAALDMKRQNSSVMLEALADNFVGQMNERARENVGFGGKEEYKEITRLSIFVGKHPAKLMVFDKFVRGEKLKGHLIITYDELSFYVLHSWCPAAEYEQKQNDFTFFEKNFSVPEKINSTFTQTAETEKKR
jgi:cytochrome b561